MFGFSPESFVPSPEDPDPLDRAPKFIKNCLGSLDRFLDSTDGNVRFKGNTVAQQDYYASYAEHLDELAIEADRKKYGRLFFELDETTKPHVPYDQDLDVAA